jgi:hypothetical protein
MRSMMRMKTLWMCALAMSLATTLPACKKITELAKGAAEEEEEETSEPVAKEEPKAEPKEEPKVEPPKEEPKVEPVAVVETPPVVEPTPVVEADPSNPDVALEPSRQPVDESLFIKTYYEVTCVQTRIDDIQQQRDIIAEIIARYGFTDESYASAKKELETKPNVQLALTERMKSCTKPVALSFMSAAEPVVEEPVVEEPVVEAPDMGAGDMGVKRPPVPTPVITGQLFARGFAAGDIQQTELMLNVTRNFKVTGSFKGLRDGKRFMVSMQGNVDRQGNFLLTGRLGQNTATARGKLARNGAMGSLEGSVFGKGYSARFNAPR